MVRRIIVSMVAGAVTFLMWWLTFAANVDTSQCQYETFKVTAYYSPLVGQDFYYRGNFTDEVILNGKGTHGASGWPVFDGMLAAPSSYAFGTKIYFPGWGIGEVADRGGAIVNKGERADATQNRIDIRAGRGEEWLIRALSFGVQYIDGWVCPEWVIPDSQVGINYDVFPQYDDFFHASLRVMSLRPEREDPRVGALQNYLIALGYMGEGRSTWYYGRETKAAVCKYQQDYLGVTGSSKRCGYFGPLTRYDMKLRLKTMWLSNLYGPEGAIVHNSISGNEAPAVQDILLSNAGELAVLEPVEVPDTLDERIINHLFTNGEFAKYQFTRAFWKWEVDKEIRILERKFQYLGYLPKDMKITGRYNMTIIEAMYQFQVDSGILHGTEDISVRGYFGERTREIMNSL